MVRENAIAKVILSTIKTATITPSNPNPDKSKPTIKQSSPTLFSAVSIVYVFICPKVRKYVSVIPSSAEMRTKKDAALTKYDALMSPNTVDAKKSDEQNKSADRSDPERIITATTEKKPSRILSFSFSPAKNRTNVADKPNIASGVNREIVTEIFAHIPY